MGPIVVGTMEMMLTDALSFDAADLRDFDPATAALRLIGIVILPFIALFALTLFAAVGAPAMLGSLGFRAQAFGFKGSKIDPLAGVKRIFGRQGLIELGKSIAKVILLGGVGAWLLLGQTRCDDRAFGAGDAAGARQCRQQLHHRGAGDVGGAGGDRDDRRAGPDVPARCSG